MNRPGHHTGHFLLRLRVDSLGEAVYHARRRVADVAGELGFRGEEVDQIDLAFTEALANAVRHGSRAPRACVHVRLSSEEGRLVVEVMDHGAGFVPGTIELPPPDDPSEGGRGLYLMRAFMDDVEWVATPRGTTVRLSKRLPALPALEEKT